MPGMSATDVTPCRSASCSARFNAKIFSSSLGSGMWCATRNIADSRRMPVGSFVTGSRSITPPSGSGGPLASIPASSSAAEFASPECPSMRCRNAGRSPVIGSIHARVGCSTTSQDSTE